MKLLYSSPSQPEVGLLKSLLDEEGIVCEVRNENVHATLPGAAFQPEIWVAGDDDYSKACQVRDAFQAPARSAAQASTAGLRAWTGFLMLSAGAVFGWQAARLDKLTGFAVAIILFGLVGIVLLSSAIPELVRKFRK